MPQFKVVETIYVEREATIEAKTPEAAESMLKPELAETTHTSRKVEATLIRAKKSVEN